MKTLGKEITGAIEKYGIKENQKDTAKELPSISAGTPVDPRPYEPLVLESKPLFTTGEYSLPVAEQLTAQADLLTGGAIAGRTNGSAMIGAELTSFSFKISHSVGDKKISLFGAGPSAQAVLGASDKGALSFIPGFKDKGLDIGLGFSFVDFGIEIAGPKKTLGIGWAEGIGARYQSKDNSSSADFKLGLHLYTKGF